MQDTGEYRVIFIVDDNEENASSQLLKPPAEVQASIEAETVKETS